MAADPGDCAPPPSQDIRPFIGIVAALVVGYYRLAHGTWLAEPVVVAAILIGFFSLVPRAMRPIANGLMRVVSRIGKFNNLLVLWLLFFLVMTPVGFFVRLLRGARIELKPSKADGSYWKARPDGGRDIDFTKMY